MVKTGEKCFITFIGLYFLFYLFFGILNTLLHGWNQGDRELSVEGYQLFRQTSRELKHVDLSLRLSSLLNMYGQSLYSMVLIWGNKS